MSPQPLDPHLFDGVEAFAALSIIEYLEDLFAMGGRETYTREQVLVILNAVKNDPDVFDPDTLLAYAEVTGDENA